MHKKPCLKFLKSGTIFGLKMIPSPLWLFSKNSSNLGAGSFPNLFLFNRTSIIMIIFLLSTAYKQYQMLIGCGLFYSKSIKLFSSSPPISCTTSRPRPFSSPFSGVALNSGCNPFWQPAPYLSVNYSYFVRQGSLT